MSNQPTIARDNRAYFAKTEAVYTFIRDYAGQEGFAPSLRDIAHGCGLGRTTVLYHLHRLLQWGLIRRSPGKARTIILVDSEQPLPWELVPTLDAEMPQPVDLQPVLEG